MRKNLLKSAMAAGALILGCSMANAGGMIGNNAEFNKNLGEAEPGVEYTLTSQGDYYVFTPTQSGLISVQTDYSGNKDAIFSSWNGTYTIFFFLEPSPAEPGLYSDVRAQGEPQLVDGGYQFYFFVEEGITYLFGYDAELETGELTFSFEYDSDLNIPDVMTYCLPFPGTTFDYASGQPDITMEFEKPLVSVESVELSYTDLEGNPASLTIPNHWETGWAIEGIKLIARIAHTKNNELFLEMRENADTSKPFYLVVNKAMCGTGPVAEAKFLYGYQGAEYVTFDGDGTFYVEYNFVDNVNLVSAEFPETFYSYWAPGNAAGMATLTFDGPVSATGANITLNMGASNDGEEINPSWNVDYEMSEDNTVMTLNFTGIDYAKSLTSNYSSVNINITGIKGTNGLLVMMTGTSNTLNKILPYVNEPYGDDEVPEIIEGTPEITPSPNTVLRELQDVVVAWDEEVSLIEGIDPEASVALGNYTPQMVNLAVEDGALVIKLSEVTIADGRYTGTAVINVPAEVVVNADGAVNDSLMIVYTLAITSSGIETIEADGVEGPVYNLKGVKVSDTLNGVDPGLYIVNGQKVVVK